MTRSVWKFPIQVTDVQEIQVPLGSKTMCVQMQQGRPTLWAYVDPEEKGTEALRLRIAGTGHLMPDDDGIIRTYLGTFQMQNGDLVFHVFEEQGIGESSPYR